jgi:GYF domain 2
MLDAVPATQAVRSKPMLYHVTRNGQSYGPYTLEDLQKYVASGNVLPTDLAKSDEMPEWVPVAQVLGASIPPANTGIYPAYPGGAPAYPPGGVAYPDPPNLHWGLVLLIGIFTCGLFTVVWLFVQASWMRKVNARSNAIFYYIAYAVIAYGGGIARFSLMASSGMRHSYPGIGLGVSLISIIIIEIGFFDMRGTLEEHFNGPEPIGLSLSGVMTFFFAPYYFQYHLTRINELKRLARYRGAAI